MIAKTWKYFHKGDACREVTHYIVDQIDPITFYDSNYDDLLINKKIKITIEVFEDYN